MHMGTTLTTVLSSGREQAEAITAQSFDQLMRQHQRRVYRVIFLLVRNDDLADVLTQECFLRAYQKLGSFRGDCRVDTWLLRIAVNLVRDHGKSRRNWFWKKLVGLEEKPADSKSSPVAVQPSPEASLLAHEELKEVWKALDSVSAQQRTIFLLRFAEEMSLAEIGGSPRFGYRQRKGAVIPRNRQGAGSVEEKTMEIIRRLKRKVPGETFIADDQYMAQSLRHLPAFARHASERPAEYWEKQQSAIWSRISSVQMHASRFSPRLVWAGITAVMALAIALLFSGSAPEPATQVASQNDSDHQLLLAVERAVQIDGPEALEPAHSWPAKLVEIIEPIQLIKENRIMKTNFLAVVALCVLSLSLRAQVLQPPVAPGPKKGVVFYHRELGKWWQNSDIVKKLQLSDGQIGQLDQIFYDHKVKLIDYGADMEKQDLKLQTLLDADVPNEGQVESQVDQVLAARGKLEREYTMMNLDLRKVLSLDQWRQLKSVRGSAGFGTGGATVGFGDKVFIRKLPPPGGGVPSTAPLPPDAAPLPPLPPAPEEIF
jgi:RNA polymerase sigma-70 factor, ECF subfamily